jgi:hypothetical protein
VLSWAGQVGLLVSRMMLKLIPRHFCLLIKCLRVRLSLEMHTVQDQSGLLDESYSPFVLLV